MWPNDNFEEKTINIEQTQGNEESLFLHVYAQPISLKACNMIIALVSNILLLLENIY